MQYLITEEQLNAVLGYLSSQPYRQVFPLINELTRLPLAQTAPSTPVAPKTDNKTVTPPSEAKQTKAAKKV